MTIPSVRVEGVRPWSGFQWDNRTTWSRGPSGGGGPARGRVVPPGRCPRLHPWFLLRGGSRWSEQGCERCRPRPGPPSRPGPAGPPPAASGCSRSCPGSRLLLRTRPNDSRVTPRSRPDALRKGRHFCRGGFAQGVITGKVFVRLRKRKKESRSGSRPPSPALAPVSGFQPSPLATRKTRPDAGCPKSHVRAGRVSRTRKGFKKSLQVLQGEIFSSANRFSK